MIVIEILLGNYFTTRMNKSDEKRILISYSFYITFIFNEPKSILKKLIDIKKKVFIILYDLFSFTSALLWNVTPSKITQNYWNVELVFVEFGMR